MATDNHRAPIDDMISDPAGRVLIIHSETRKERWAYPIDAREIMSLDSHWVFASKANPLPTKAVVATPSAKPVPVETSASLPQQAEQATAPAPKARAGVVRDVAK